MKKLRLILLLSALIILGLNINITTQQCINYRCQTIKIPLWIKVIEFYDRDYHYGKLAKEIIKNTPDTQERAMKILEWVHENIRRMPEGFPVVDDHAWHIIIRGYGVDDQFQDVFTTLSNYAGLGAFFTWITSDIDSKKIALSFVKLKNNWTIFDAYNGVYFKNGKGEISGVNDLLGGNWQAVSVLKREIASHDYRQYFKNLQAVNYGNWGLSRAAVQSPLRRFILWGRSLVIKKTSQQFLFDR